MTILQDVQALAEKKLNKNIPRLRSGLTVRVHQKIKEGEKERIQIYEGLVINVNSGHGADKSFTVRKLVDGIGVEKIFPLYSPTLANIEVVKVSKTRRAKLFYMRDRKGKSAKLKEQMVSASSAELEYSEKKEEEAILETPPAVEQKDVATETVENTEVKTDATQAEPKVEEAAKEEKVEEDKSENKEEK